MRAGLSVEGRYWCIKPRNISRTARCVVGPSEEKAPDEANDLRKQIAGCKPDSSVHSTRSPEPFVIHFL
jgi:hypothetical protein